jgi:hypothetical protein
MVQKYLGQTEKESVGEGEYAISDPHMTDRHYLERKLSAEFRQH